MSADLLEALFGPLAGLDACLWLPVVRAPGFQAARWVPAHDLDAFAAAALEVDDRGGTTGVFVNACPLRRRPCSGRGGAADVGALVALWADIDVAGPGHAGDDLPPTIDAALDIVDAVGLEPTAIVATGGGLHVWWALAAPWLFEDDDERRRAADVAGAWGDSVVARARGLGYALDDVGDLPRVLRVPGTTNRKPGRPATVVELVTCRPAVRYLLEDLADVLAPPAPAPAQRPRLSASDGRYGPAQACEVLTWADILEPHGWRRARRPAGRCDCGSPREGWAHPAVPVDHHGEPDHISATACCVLVVHSSNPATGLGRTGGFSKFDAFAVLNWPAPSLTESRSLAARALRHHARRAAQAAA